MPPDRRYQKAASRQKSLDDALAILKRAAHLRRNDDWVNQYRKRSKSELIRNDVARQCASHAAPLLGCEFMPVMSVLE